MKYITLEEFKKQKDIYLYYKVKIDSLIEQMELYNIIWESRRASITTQIPKWYFTEELVLKSLSSSILNIRRLPKEVLTEDILSKFFKQCSNVKTIQYIIVLSYKFNIKITKRIYNTVMKIDSKLAAFIKAADRYVELDEYEEYCTCDKGICFTGTCKRRICKRCNGRGKLNWISKLNC